MKVVEQSKTAVMEAVAIQDSDQMRASVTSVIDALRAFAEATAFSKELFEKATSAISACGGASAHLAACKASEKPEAVEKATALESTMATLHDQLDKEFFTSKGFASFLDGLWKSGLSMGLPAERVKVSGPTEEAHLTPKDFLSRMQLEGTVGHSFVHSLGSSFTFKIFTACGVTC